MLVDKKKLIIAGIAAIGSLALAYVLGKGCQPDPIVVEKPDTVVDTSSVDRAIEAKKIEAEKQSAMKIDALEKKHAEDIEQFNDEQREEYEHIKKKGSKAVANWLTDFNKDLRQR